MQKRGFYTAVLSVVSMATILVLMACAGKKKPMVAQPAMLAPDVIQSHVAKKKKRTTACYQAYIDQNKSKIKKDPEAAKLDGVVYVKFNVDQKGKVQDATVENNSFEDAELGACVLAVVNSVSFPKPKGEGLVRVHYPFRFYFQGNYWTRCNVKEDCTLVSGYCGESRAINKRFVDRFNEVADEVKSEVSCEGYVQGKSLAKEVVCARKRCRVSRTTKVTGGN